MPHEQQLRTAQRQKTELLPGEVATEQQSLVAVKKLLAIAVSSITYLRGLFPEKAYGSKFVEEQKVMILREERSCPGASQIVQWMQGCFDALQRKYLRNVTLSIYTDPENPQKVTECYHFKIQYTAKGPQMDFESKNNNKVATMACSNIKKASILLVRKLYTLMQNLGPLPDNVCLNMKLFYYDEVTPQDYNPPGFKDGDSDVIEFEREPIKLTMGEVVTPFHTLKVDITTERHRLEQVEQEEVEKEEAVCVEDNWMLRMEEEGSVRQISTVQSHVIEDVERPDSDNPYLDNTEVLLTCHEKMEVCEEVTVSSPKDPLVKRAPNVETSHKRTRSGSVARPTMRTRSKRVTKATTERKSTEEVKEVTKKPSPASDKMLSQFEFPSSQDIMSASVNKRRKFSEPKECY